MYKQNELVIRLKSIQFPVGKEIIMPNNYEMLSRVQQVIRTFGEPDVVIEGHMDSTAIDEVNEHLSQKRADSVRDYFKSRMYIAIHQDRGCRLWIYAAPGIEMNIGFSRDDQSTDRCRRQAGLRGEAIAL